MIVLESERLLFRDHEPADLDAYCAMEADPEVRRYVGGAPRTREAAERKFPGGSQRPESDRLRMWATVYKPDSCYIGRCGVYQHFGPSGPVPGEGSLAFYLARAYWGRGLATEAGRALVNFGFQELGLSKIVTAVQVGNDASVRVLEKLGFALVRTETGEFRSFYHFELLP
jgi:ribosomal-protein-alanine N-acetyltransferase